MIRMICALILGMTALQAQAETRSAHAHVHGASHLAIAISLDGTDLAMQLKAPGHDIAGFEAPPADDAQATRLAQAIERLNDPLTLFGLDPEAGCRLSSVEVAAKGYDAAAPSADGHAEFEASYQITCDSAPSGLHVTYFTAFAEAGSLDVDVLTADGAAEQTLTAAEPGLTFPTP